MANTENANAIDISMVKFDEKGLVPAVVQEENGQVLMLAYMNEESLKKTLETGYTWFFSRSRQKLWQKGETSGNVQKVKEISYDCDGDTLLVRVHQTGVACHTGTYTCFSGRKLMGGEEKGIAVVPPEKKADLAEVLYDLYNVIQDRRLNPVEGSYTNYLFEKGQDKILKKVGEEAVETIIASKNNVRKDVVYEMGDLWYHCLVLLAYHNISPEELFAELMGRRKGAAYHKFTGKTGVRPDLGYCPIAVSAAPVVYYTRLQSPSGHRGLFHGWQVIESERKDERRMTNEMTPEQRRTGRALAQLQKRIQKMHALRDKMNAGLARVTEENLDLALTQKKNLRALSAEYDELAKEVSCLPPLDAASVLEEEYNYILTIGNIIETTRELKKKSKIDKDVRESITSGLVQFYEGLRAELARTAYQKEQKQP